MLNFSADIFFWTILQLSFTENIWNYYIDQKECLGLTNNQKKKKKKNLKYLILEIRYTFSSIFN